MASFVECIRVPVDDGTSDTLDLALYEEELDRKRVNIDLSVTRHGESVLLSFAALYNYKTTASRPDTPWPRSNGIFAAKPAVQRVAEKSLPLVHISKRCHFQCQDLIAILLRLGLYKVFGQGEELSADLVTYGPWTPVALLPWLPKQVSEACLNSFKHCAHKKVIELQSAILEPERIVKLCSER